MTSNRQIYTIKTIEDHVEIFDFFNRFICSGDNEQDAIEGLEELYGQEKETLRS